MSPFDERKPGRGDRPAKALSRSATVKKAKRQLGSNKSSDQKHRQQIKKAQRQAKRGR